MDRWLPFAIGDWLNYGERVWGETYAQAMSDTDMEYQRLADYKWVSTAVPISVRNEKLFWSHHRLVAPYADDPETQQGMLQHAETYRLTTRQFKEDIQELYLDNGHGPGITDTPKRCPTCGQVIP
jgi:hypothetical protein